MFVHDLIERVRQAFAPRIRDQSADEAIKALHEARDAARRAAKLIEGSQPRIARDLSKRKPLCCW